MKVVTTNWLKKAQQLARRRGFNRLLNRAQEEALDPDGKHVLSDQSFFQEGVKYNSVRCLTLLKLRGQTGPHTVVLDIALEDYNAVPEYECVEE